MTRMLAALAAVSLLTAVAVQSAAAKPGGKAAGGPPAPGDVQEQSSSATASGDGATATATATCPSGTKASGGGFSAPPSGDAVPLVYESVKVGHRDWRASVQSLDAGDPDPITLTTYVYCRKHFHPTKTVSTTVPTTGQVHIGPTAEATCPRGETATAGGFSLPAPLISPTVTALFFDSIRSGTSAWDVRVVTGPAGTSNLTSEAYCSQRDAPLEAVASSAANGLDSTPSTATAACPAGLSAGAGGFAQPGSMVVSFFFVYESRRVGDGWKVSGLHSGSDPAVPLTAAAYCA
jgi:hypothetical protein